MAEFDLLRPVYISNYKVFLKLAWDKRSIKSLSLKPFCQDLIIVGFLELVKGFIFIEPSFSEDR